MRKILYFFGLFMLVALTAAGCANRFGRNREPQPTPPPPAAGNQVFDCTESACPRLSVKNDNDSRLPSGQPAAFRGNADPSMRQDPVTGRLWLAYSWPHVVSTGGQRRQGVDIHLAKSDDGGKTWNFVRKLWASSAGSDLGGNGENGFISHEVANLLPVQEREKVTWYGVRLDYFLPASGGYQRRPPESFLLKIGRADSPENLAAAEMASLASAATDPGWQADVNLAQLSPSLSKCQLWNEPALHFADGQLYLGVRCLSFRGKRTDMANSGMEIFATSAQGQPKSWQWRHVGTLAPGSLGKEFGAEGVTQFDFALSRDGKLLALMTPEEFDPQNNDDQHRGCLALEVASLNPPLLAKGTDGKPVIRASVVSSDSSPLGPGACAYEPQSSTGLIMTRRNKYPQEFTTSLNQTGLRP